MNQSIDTLRPASTVMRLARLGSLHQCRLSFMRQLTRRMARERWQFVRSRFDINAQGEGVAVYTARTPERAYSLVAFAHDLPDHLRSDRVIAEAWDATFALFDGEPTDADIARLAANVPKQEAGRVSERELCLSRANRSVRLWQTLTDTLASGQQPTLESLQSVGYLMRTTAVYGSGKFGAADRENIADRPEMQSPFQAEMLSVFLTRAFVRDLVNFMAKIKGGARAVELAPELAQTLGIGNSTGLGMAPFLINHPLLLNNWIRARETALARVLAVGDADATAQAIFLRCLEGAKRTVAGWHSEHPLQLEKLKALRSDLDLLDSYLAALAGAINWPSLIEWSAQNLSAEGQELLVSLMLEPYGDLVDDLSSSMSDECSQGVFVDGAMTVDSLKADLERHYQWALDIDWQSPDSHARVWYVSEEKLEPRLGERALEPIEDYAQPLAPAKDMADLAARLGNADPVQSVADFLSGHPECRFAVKRLQLLAHAPYAELHDNSIDAQMLPIDMLRAKLSFFGATCFDPRSDRWLRIAMYAGAPYPEELNADTADYWVYPGVSA